MIMLKFRLASALPLIAMTACGNATYPADRLSPADASERLTLVLCHAALDGLGYDQVEACVKDARKNSAKTDVHPLCEENGISKEGLDRCEQVVAKALNDHPNRATNTPGWMRLNIIVASHEFNQACGPEIVCTK